MSTETPVEPMQTDVPLGMLLVISGPAGVGKDTVWKASRECLPTFAKATTCTTRPQRPGEVHGVNYYFVSEEEFDRLLHENQLLEWAHVHNYRYGVPGASVLERLVQGEDVVCVIDVQGALTIRALFPNALLIFLKPPADSTDILEQRIRDRSNVSDDELELRINTARWELAQTKFYDHEIINDEVHHAAEQLCAIVEKEKAKRQETGTSSQESEFRSQ